MRNPFLYHRKPTVLRRFTYSLVHSFLASLVSAPRRTRVRTMHRRYLSPIFILAQDLLSLADIVTYSWDVTWVNGSPDGFARPIIGINGRWPCPVIEANVGDTIVVHLTNLLGNETSGIHFHGVNQIDSPEMDGSTGVSQCPCPPNNTMSYSFLVSDNIRRLFVLNGSYAAS